VVLQSSLLDGVAFDPFTATGDAHVNSMPYPREAIAARSSLYEWMRAISAMFGWTAPRRLRCLLGLVQSMKVMGKL
jgi:hypothetical protein